MPNDLTEYVRYHYSSTTAEETRHLFNQLQVRIPFTGEFYEANDEGGAIVFLDSAACCIRITNNFDHPHIRHDRILQPLFTRELSSQDMRIDIFPGVRFFSSCEHNDYGQKLFTSLKDGGIDWWDSSEDNMGFILHDDTPHPLVIDAGSARYFSDEVKEIRQKLAAQSPKPSVQQAVFGDLYASFEKAFPTGQSRADARAMNDSWALCREFAERGILVPAWKTNNYNGTTLAAARYNAHVWHLALEAA